MSDDVASRAGSPSTDPDENACREPADGIFTLAGETGCLGRGGATTVFGAPAFDVEPAADCTSPAAQWQLTPAVAGTFTVRNIATDLLLDVRAGSDVPGVPLILYEANTLDNQRFWLRPRRADTFELSPRHAPSLCAEARASAVEMWPCDAESRSQDLVLLSRWCR